MHGLADWMKMKNILVVESEVALADSIKSRFEARAEFAVDIVPSGYGALSRLGASVPDALVLSTTLPDLSGWELCRVVRSRSRTAYLPMILLGAPSSGVGPVNALELGADDYVTKPFDVAELEARLRAVMRRRRVHDPHPEPDHFRDEHIDANFTDVFIAVDGHPVQLTKREFLLLRCLVHHRNQVLNRETLLEHVWNEDGLACRVVDSAVAKLRTKLQQAGQQIETVIGFGYRFTEVQSRKGEPHEDHRLPRCVDRRPGVRAGVRARG
jgi:DNA-binding response OmpR family regulator